MKSHYLILVLIITIGILTTLSMVLYKQSQSDESFVAPTGTQTQTGSAIQTENTYPLDMIEGFITELAKDKFKIEVNVNKILPTESISIKEVLVLIKEETEFSFYNLKTKEETLAVQEDIGINDPVVIVIQKNNLSILTQETFIAKKVTKMIGLPPPISE